MHVSVCGKLEGDPCHQYADASFYIDYSNRDALLRLVDSEKFDYLVPTCNDFSYMSCAWVAEQRRFPGFDSYAVATVLHTKNAFREVTERHGIPAPRSRRQQSGRPVDIGRLRLPVLVKPVDSFSGRGVTKVDHEGNVGPAIEAARQASRSGEVVVEEFVGGTLHSHSAFIRGKRIVGEVFVDEYCTVYPYQVNCSNHPSLLTDPVQRAVSESIAQLVEILELEDGLLHTQFIANGDQFWIIECMRRCPGDLYGSLIEMSTGIRYVDMFLRPFVGEKIPEELHLGAAKPYGRHTISTRRAVATYTFSHRIPATDVRIVPLKNGGERLDVAPFDKLAILFAEFADRSTMFEATPRLAELVNIQSLEETYLESQNAS